MVKHMTLSFLTFGLSSGRAVGLSGLWMSVTLTHAYSANVNRAYMGEHRAKSRAYTGTELLDWCIYISCKKSCFILKLLH